jgi:hypothetical protein
MSPGRGSAEETGAVFDLQWLPPGGAAGVVPDPETIAGRMLSPEWTQSQRGRDCSLTHAVDE